MKKTQDVSPRAVTTKKPPRLGKTLFPPLGDILQPATELYVWDRLSFEPRICVEV